MNTYETEEEQVKALKQWWQDNGRAVIIGLVVGVGGIVGWQYWQTEQLNQALQASDLYQKLVTEMQQPGAQAIETAHTLQAEYPKTPYSDLAGFQQAQAQLATGQREAAIQSLLNLAQSTGNPSIKHLAQLRAYRLQLAAGQAQQVVDQLANIETGQFSGQFQELKGDALLSLGQIEQARSAYISALASGTVDQRLLQLKLDDLGGIGPVSEAAQ